MILLLATTLFHVSIVSAQDLSRYYPLQKGAEWEMKGIGTSPTFQTKSVGPEKINGLEYMKISEIMKDGTHKENIIRYIRMDDNRIYWRYKERKKKSSCLISALE